MRALFILLDVPDCTVVRLIVPEPLTLSESLLCQPAKLMKLAVYIDQEISYGETTLS